ncbi:CD63 antigen-like [Megalops cyprinoides]|uniref:CD63 antigen-like n=1 Tax=Megalops cyprinoides TaxID=118141 RepID=UPI0018648431|nr:CD63 antigen-like [Megalops cyprinoides]
MAVAGGTKCIKYLLFFFNFLFWICGLALIILGIVVQVAIHNTPVIEKVSGSAAPIVLIVVGVIIFFIAFFGCCGAWKESYWMVAMFAVLLSLIIIIEIGAAIAGYVFRGKLGEIVDTRLKDMIARYNSSSADFRKTVDKMQETECERWLKCCGANSTADWADYDKDHMSVPDSCCKTVTTGCGKAAMHNPSKMYQTGCLHAVEDLLKKNVQVVIVGALVIAFLQITGIVFACLLMRGIRSGYEVM